MKSVEITYQDGRKKRKDYSYQGSCFPGSCLIATPSGPKRLSDVQVGNSVFSLSKSTGSVIVSRVLEIQAHSPEPLVRILLSNGATIRCTSNHLLHSDTGWIKAGKLAHGDSLKILTESGYASSSVVEVSEQSNLDPVYNLVVSDEFNYFVDGVLASCFCLAPRAQMQIWKVAYSLRYKLGIRLPGLVFGT